MMVRGELKLVWMVSQERSNKLWIKVGMMVLKGEACLDGVS